MSERIRPWGDTDAFAEWDDENCSTCIKEGERCDLWMATTEWSLRGVEISADMLKRLGYPYEGAVTLRWPCKERVREDDPPTPAAYEMAAAGAAPLPGFAAGADARGEGG